MFAEISLIGYVGYVEAARTTKNGHTVLNFRVAVNDKQQTTWFKVTAWDSLAEMLSQHLAVGQMVLVKGRPGLETFVTREQDPAAQLTVTADTFRFLGSKPE